MNRRIRALFFCTLAGVILAAGSPPALAFSVAENPNNSLDTFPNNPGDPLINSGGVTTLVVEPGINTALGGLGSCIGFSCNDSYDSFRMHVPAGLEITLTELLVENPDGTAEQLWVFEGPPGGAGVIRMPVHLNTDWQVGELFRLTDNITTINGPAPNSTNFVLGPGFYDVIGFNFNFTGAGAFEATFHASYIVPLPPAAVLLLPALGILGVNRKRGQV